MVTPTIGLVAVAVSNKLTPMIIEVTQVNERIMRLRIPHSFGVISLVSVYAPTEASDLTVKDAFYATPEPVIDQCPRRDTLLVLGDFNASNGSDRIGYETCVGPHGSRTVNANSTKFQSLEEVVDLWWLVQGFSTHRLIAGDCGKGD